MKVQIFLFALIIVILPSLAHSNCQVGKSMSDTPENKLAIELLKEMKFKERASDQVSEHLTTIANFGFSGSLPDKEEINRLVKSAIENGANWECIYSDVANSVAENYSKKDIELWIKLLQSDEYKSFHANKESIGVQFQKSFGPYYSAMADYLKAEIRGGK